MNDEMKIITDTIDSMGSGTVDARSVGLLEQKLERALAEGFMFCRRVTISILPNCHPNLLIRVDYGNQIGCTRYTWTSPALHRLQLIEAGAGEDAQGEAAP